MNNKFVNLLLLLVILIVAAFFRFHGLSRIPGFEYDEGATTAHAVYMLKAGLDDPMAWLVGEKVYRGAVMQWLLFFCFLLFGVSVVTARALVAACGVILVWLIYKLAARLLGSENAGLLAASIVAVSPWHIAASRTVHSLVLVPLFTAWSLLLLLPPRERANRLFIAGILWGLAMHGHLYMALMIIPIVVLHIFEREYQPINNRRSLRLIISGAVASLSPWLLYNALSDFSGLMWYLSSPEGHPVGLGSGLVSRFFQRLFGYLWTLFHALKGDYFWLDAYQAFAGAGSIILPLLFFVAVLFIALKGAGEMDKVSLFIISWLLVALLVVPQITKHRSWEGFDWIKPSLPLYLDIISVAWPVIIAAFAISLGEFFLGQKTKNLIVLSMAGIFTLFPLHNLYFNIYPVCASSGGFGRWESGFSLVKDHIDGLMDERTYIACSPVFGGLYPQLRTIYGDRRVIPYYGQIHGLYRENNELVEGTILRIEPSDDVKPQPGAEIRRLKVSPQKAITLSIYKSPYVSIHIKPEEKRYGLDMVGSGLGVDGKLKGYGLLTDYDRNLVHRLINLRRTDGYQPVEIRQHFFTVPGDQVFLEPLSRRFNGCRIEGDLRLNADQFEPFTLELNLSGKSKQQAWSYRFDSTSLRFSGEASLEQIILR